MLPTENFGGTGVRITSVVRVSTLTTTPRQAAGAIVYIGIYICISRRNQVQISVGTYLQNFPRHFVA